MRGGALDRRISFQEPVIVDDPVYGPGVGDWKPFASRVAAQVWDDLPGRSEAVQNGLRMANRPARVRIRYMLGLRSDMRVVLHGETDQLFEISGGPAELGRREWIELTIKAYSS